MPEIDGIITGEFPVSAYGFSGLHEAVKYLSDYSLQLEMVRQVGLVWIFSNSLNISTKKSFLSLRIKSRYFYYVLGFSWRKCPCY